MLNGVPSVMLPFGSMKLVAQYGGQENTQCAALLCVHYWHAPDFVGMEYSEAVASIYKKLHGHRTPETMQLLATTCCQGVAAVMMAPFIIRASDMLIELTVKNVPPLVAGRGVVNGLYHDVSDEQATLLIQWRELYKALMDNERLHTSMEHVDLRTDLMLARFGIIVSELFKVTGGLLDRTV
jgi:hypothetical protein